MCSLQISLDCGSYQVGGPVSTCFFFFFKQKTAYELRISDWSSDVCSSDLIVLRPPPGNIARPAPPVRADEGSIGQSLGQGMSQPGLAAAERADDVGQWPDIGQFEPFAAPGPGQVEGDGGRHGLRHQPGQRAEIGRASCRAEVCRYVEIPGG